MLTWRDLFMVAMVKFLQLLLHKFLHPQLFILPPKWTQGPGNWGTPRDRNAVIFGLAWTDKPANCPARLHTLTCGHSRMHTLSRTHKASVAAETSCSSVSNPSQQSAVLTTRTLRSWCQRKTTLEANTHSVFGSWLTCRPSPGIWLK